MASFRALLTRERGGLSSHQGCSDGLHVRRHPASQYWDVYNRGFDAGSAIDVRGVLGSAQAKAEWL